MMENYKPTYLKLSRTEQKAALEAIIFSSDEPLSIKLINQLLILQNIPQPNQSLEDSSQDSIDKAIYKDYLLSDEFIQELVDEINSELQETGRSFQIVKFGGGYQFATRKEYGELIHNLVKTRSKRRLSQAALESLAIIAYRQPVTKPEVDQIRGVNSTDVINTLAEKGLIRMVGRREAIGKPLLYGTTTEFLKIFGLNSLDDLPKLRELEEIADNLSKYENEQNEIVLNFVDASGKLIEKTETNKDELLTIKGAEMAKYDDEELEEGFDEFDESDEFEEFTDDELEEIPEDFDMIDDSFEEYGEDGENEL
jgi:segregation and condensation protein B